jgi:ATP-dependent Clp protease ATP-binding subunit ClpB
MKRLETQKEMSITLTEPAKKLLAKKGYDPAFGARPLKRVIQSMLLDPLALKIVNGEIKEGAVITVGAKGEELTIKTNEK